MTNQRPCRLMAVSFYKGLPFCREELLKCQAAHIFGDQSLMIYSGASLCLASAGRYTYKDGLIKILLEIYAATAFSEERPSRFSASFIISWRTFKGFIFNTLS